jgi:hypothetical protein
VTLTRHGCSFGEREREKWMDDPVRLDRNGTLVEAVFEAMRSRFPQSSRRGWKWGRPAFRPLRHVRPF